MRTPCSIGVRTWLFSQTPTSAIDIGDIGKLDISSSPDFVHEVAPPKQQQQKAVSANQMGKQRLKSELPRTMFQRKKRAEELVNGMDVRNAAAAALEKLGDKVKEEEIIVASAKAAGDEAATWAAKCAEQKPKFPPRALCYSVSVAL